MADTIVFVVDDEQDNLEYMRAILEEEGCTVETFDDGNAALEKMRAAAPALVFVDVQMPKINGLQVLKGVRSLPDGATIPVVMLSAIGAVTGEDYSPELIEAKYGVRPNAFVSKPIVPEKVAEQVKLLLPA